MIGRPMLKKERGQVTAQTFKVVGGVVEGCPERGSYGIVSAHRGVSLRGDRVGGSVRELHKGVFEAMAGNCDVPGRGFGE